MKTYRALGAPYRGSPAPYNTMAISYRKKPTATC